MKKILFVLAGVLLVGAGCFQKPDSLPVDQQNDVEDGDEVTIDPAGSTAPTEDYINGDTVPVYEDGVLQSLRSAEYGNIYVLSPFPGSMVGDSMIITGNARVFENVVSYRVKDVSGAVVASGFTMANSPDIGQYGAYQFNTDLSAVPAQTLTVEVYWESAKDGSDADLVSFLVEKQ